MDDGKLVFIVVLVHYSLYSLEMEATQMSLDKENVVYTDNGILLNLKKDENCHLLSHGWKTFEDITLTEVSQPLKKKHIA